MKITGTPQLVATAFACVLAAACALPARAQDVLPRPEQPFGGKIGRTTKESVKDFPKPVEAPTGAPNILLILTFAQILNYNGYNTSWYGKNHNVPDWQSSQAGPFDLWPTQ